MQKKAVAVLTGGLGSERTVALASATRVAEALAPHYDVSLFRLPEEWGKFVMEHAQFVAAVPIIHGKGGEDGAVQRELEKLGMPYLFSTPEAHEKGIDKLAAKALARDAGLLTADWQEVDRQNPPAFVHPIVVKPADSGSSVGVSLVRTAEELPAALDKAFAESHRVFVEDLIDGDEFSVAVIDENGKPVALPVISIKSSNAFFDYEAKYTPGAAEELCPALIAPDLAARLQQAAVTAHAMIGARQVSRSDFLVDHDGRIWFLEINTIPGMSVLLPKAIAASGRTFGDVLASWVEESIA